MKIVLIKFIDHVFITHHHLKGIKRAVVLSMRSIIRECVKNIAYTYNRGKITYFITHELIRITASVISFMMMHHCIYNVWIMNFILFYYFHTVLAVFLH